MKKIVKKVMVLLAMGTFLIGSTVTVKADEMDKFPLQQEGAASSSYTRGIQVMLLNFNSATRNFILNGGGADGSFGGKTTEAVRSFQSACGIGVDGQCGRDTWKKFRSTLRLNSTGSYKYYEGLSPYYNNHYNMRQVNAYDGTWYCYYAGSWYYVG
ncbi:peptidoglycan-binding domain-containing protein [Blautia sp.]|uniref:peptidoglycan-binding domain-containing protein n=1 Tax=Blautia sp. TaxID=1955243 RepID=UPI00258A7283|nr:peptidoglycan-binding domain-containing protein [Blautia sp.]